MRFLKFGIGVSVIAVFDKLDVLEMCTTALPPKPR
jgi:hypothetical protein